VKPNGLLSEVDDARRDVSKNETPSRRPPRLLSVAVVKALKQSSLPSKTKFDGLDEQCPARYQQPAAMHHRRKFHSSVPLAALVAEIVAPLEKKLPATPHRSYPVVLTRNA
jgi:hypothetical protein